MKTKRRPDDYDGIDVTHSGRVVNRDAEPEEARRGVKKGKSKQRLQEATEEAKKSLRKKETHAEGYKQRDEARNGDVKKKKKKTAGELIAKGKTKGLSKKLDRFESKALAIMGTLDSDQELLPAITASSGSETEFFNEYGRIFATLQAILRRLEKNMLDEDKNVSSKDVYALCTMYSQMRETIGDMRSIKDMQAQAESFSQEVIDPLKRSCGEALLAFYYKVNQIVRHHVTNANVLETISEQVKLAAAEQGGKMESEFKTATSKIVDVLNGSK